MKTLYSILLFLGAIFGASSAFSGVDTMSPVYQATPAGGVSTNYPDPQSACDAIATNYLASARPFTAVGMACNSAAFGNMANLSPICSDSTFSYSSVTGLCQKTNTCSSGSSFNASFVDDGTGAYALICIAGCSASVSSADNTTQPGTVTGTWSFTGSSCSGAPPATPGNSSGGTGSGTGSGAASGVPSTGTPASGIPSSGTGGGTGGSGGAGGTGGTGGTGGQGGNGGVTDIAPLVTEATKSNGFLSDIKAALGFGQQVDTAGTVGKDVAVSSQLKADIQAQVDGAVSAQSSDESSVLGFFTLSLPAQACTPFSGSVHFLFFNIDVCRYTEMLRDLLGYLFALFGAISVYETLLRKPT